MYQEWECVRVRSMQCVAGRRSPCSGLIETNNEAALFDSVLMFVWRRNSGFLILRASAQPHRCFQLRWLIRPPLSEAGQNWDLCKVTVLCVLMGTLQNPTDMLPIWARWACSPFNFSFNTQTSTFCLNWQLVRHVNKMSHLPTAS